MQQVQERNPDIPLPSDTLQLLLGGPEVLPGQKGYIIPPASPRSALGPPPSGLENLQSEATRRHPNQMSKPPQLAPFEVEEQWLYSELPLNGGAPHPISKAEPSHPPNETHFSRLYPQSRSFSHYPDVLTIGAG